MGAGATSSSATERQAVGSVSTVGATELLSDREESPGVQLDASLVRAVSCNERVGGQSVGHSAEDDDILPGERAERKT